MESNAVHLRITHIYLILYPPNRFEKKPVLWRNILMPVSKFPKPTSTSQNDT